MHKFKCTICNISVKVTSKHTRIMCAACSSEMVLQPKTFKGGQIISLRHLHKVTQSSLAESLGISAGYLSKIETNLAPLTDVLIEKLGEMFKVAI